MNPAVCTVFEGTYHYGLGALANSLWRHGYRGDIWAGYRGPLPPWAGGAQDRGTHAELQVPGGGRICFVPVQTDIHLTNYKATFMLHLWEQLCRDCDALFYFDPDITVKCEWSYFEEWVRCGVALCEDLNSPMNPTHPLRLRWRKLFEPHGIAVNSTLNLFVNGGFVGLQREHRSFLHEWQRIMDLVAGHVGDLQAFMLGGRTLLFQNVDQDALNVALYSTKLPVSVIGAEGMDFRGGGYTMSHAAGARKPWAKRIVWSALRGIPPTIADKCYWDNVSAPLRLYPASAIALRRAALKLAAAIGRFIKRH